MLMSGLRLYKTEKLCSKIEIEKLYGGGTSIIAYPLRAVWLVAGADEVGGHRVAARFLVSIPKKRIRHAVDRVLLRRRVREAYRLNRHLLEPVAAQGKVVLIGFNWLSNHEYSYATINRSMQEMLSKIAATVSQPNEPCG